MYVSAGFQSKMIRGILFVIVVMMWSPVDATPPPSGSGSDGWTSIEILQRADDLAGNERFKEASYLYRRFLKENPNHAAAVLGLARCVERLDGRDEAREFFQRVLDLDPGNEEAKQSVQESSLPVGEAMTPVEPAVSNPPPIAIPTQVAGEPEPEVILARALSSHFAMKLGEKYLTRNALRGHIGEKLNQAR